MPVQVDYQLTPLGADLQRLVQPLKAWAERNMDEVLTNRQRAAA